MPAAKKPVDFSFKSTSVTFQELDGGAGATHVNYEGKATGFGTVLGTLSFFSEAPGAQGGTTHWVGTAFLDNGDEVTGSSDGYWERTGNHKWRVRGLMRTSAGTTYTSGGVVSLDGRTYKGQLSEWA